MDQAHLLSSFSAGGERRPRGWAGLWLSASGHGVVAGLAGAIALLGPARLPAPGGHNSLPLFFDPAPPPAPRLPLGSPAVPRTERTLPASPEETAETSRPVLPSELVPPIEAPIAPVAAAPERAGDPSGSLTGVPEGMENGSENGVPGGVPGGRPGGQIGGTGTNVLPVSGYDRPPRLVRQAKPSYPHDAFLRKIEGEVLLEILIDASGRVVHARVLRSIPLLDASAIQAVSDWRFEPALKHGRPVPALGRATVRFSLI